MKKSWFLIVVLMFVLVLQACGGEENLANDVNANSNDDPDKVHVLKFTSPAPDAAVFTQANDALVKYIEEQSEGRIKFERYYGGTLVKPGDELDSLGAGIIDMAVFSNSYVPGKLPLSTVTTTVSAWQDAWVGSKVFDELYKTNDNLTNELSQYGIKHLGNFSLPASYMFSVKPVNKLEDLKKMNIVANGQASNLAKELGANAISVPVEDLYETISKGTADAVLYGDVEAVTFGLSGEVKYIYELPIGSEAGMVAISQKKFDTLPSDLQELLLKAVSEQYPIILHEVFQVDGAGKAREQLIKDGAIVVEPTDADKQKVKEIAQTKVWAAWENDLEKTGNNPGDLLDQVQKLIEKYEADPTNPNNK